MTVYRRITTDSEELISPRRHRIQANSESATNIISNHAYQYWSRRCLCGLKIAMSAHPQHVASQMAACDLIVADPGPDRGPAAS